MCIYLWVKIGKNALFLSFSTTLCNSKCCSRRFRYYYQVSLDFSKVPNLYSIIDGALTDSGLTKPASLSTNSFYFCCIACTFAFKILMITSDTTFLFSTLNSLTATPTYFKALLYSPAPNDWKLFFRQKKNFFCQTLRAAHLHTIFLIFSKRNPLRGNMRDTRPAISEELKRKKEQTNAQTDLYFI